MVLEIHGKILLVEDDGIEALDIKESLEQFGFKVVGVASNAEDAIKQSRAYKPDLILLDIILKGKNSGVKVAQQIKDLNIPIIYLTAHSEQATVDEAKRTGPYGYIIKPFDPMELKCSIELALHKSQLEQDLRDSERKFRLITENTGDVIWILDIESGKFNYVSPSVYQLRGYTPEEVIDQTIDEVMTPESYNYISQRLPSRIKRFMAGDKSLRVHKSIINQYKKDGSVVPTEVVTTLITNPQGKVKEILGVSRDISEHQEMERLRREEDFKLRSKLDNLLSETYEIKKDELKDILDIPAIKSIMGDFCKITDMGFTITDADGDILLSIGWQEVCSDFHRKNKDSCENCIRSNAELTKSLKLGEFRRFKCKNNMNNMATPIIIGNHHVGNLLMGQFFFQEEEFDYEAFKIQAEKYGYNTDKYFKALEMVPRWNRDKVETIMRFYYKLGQIISNYSFNNLHLAKMITELKLTQSDLENSKNTLSHIINSIPQSVFWKNLDSTYLGCNVQFAESMGLDNPEDVVGKTDFDLTGSVREAESYQKDDQEVILNHQYKHNIIKSLRTSDDDHRWIDITKVALIREDGTLYGVLGVYDDITENKAATDALKESESLLRGLFDNMTSGVAIYSVKNHGKHGEDYIIKEFNKTSLEIEEKTLEEVKGKTLLDLRPKIDEYGLIPIFQEVWETGIPKYYPAKIYVDDHYANWYENYVFKIPTGDIVAIYNDITEQKHAEEALLKSQKHLEKAQKVGHTGSWDWDILNNTLIWSDELYRIFGIDKEFELNFESIESFIHPDDQPKNSKKVNEMLTQGQDTDFEFRIIRNNGEIRHIHQNIELTKNKQGQVKSAFGIMQDITGMKRIEEALKKSLYEKELLIKEIHHRVKNNMQIISSLLNLQSIHLKDEEIVDLLKESQNRVKSMAKIHEKLYQSQDFSRILVSEYIESLVLDLFYSYAVDKTRVQLKLDLEEVMLNIETAVPVGLIINELISNSLKYAFPKGKGQIEVKFNQNDDQYNLTISDNGIGLPNNFDYKNISSLGLQLVNSLTNQLDSELKVNGQQGTQFSLKFKELQYQERL